MIKQGEQLVVRETGITLTVGPPIIRVEFGEWRCFLSLVDKHGTIVEYEWETLKHALTKGLIIKPEYFELFEKISDTQKRLQLILENEQATHNTRRP